MLNSTEIKQLSEDVDNAIATLATKYGVGPLSLSAIITARLIALHRECGSEQDLRDLITTALRIKIEEPSYANYSHH